MSAKVVKFYPANAAEDPDNVLEQAIGLFNSVLIIGWDKDGNLDASASANLTDGGEMLWLIETFKRNLLSGDYQA